MRTTEDVLAIEIGSVYSRAFLLQVRDAHPGLVELAEHQQILSSLPISELIEVFKLRFKGRFDRVEIVDDPQKWFQRSIAGFSDRGGTLGILVGDERVFIEQAEFGRTTDSRELKFGFAHNFDQMMSAGGLESVADWLDVAVGENERAKALNNLGNFSLYPTFSFRDDLGMAALLGLLRFVLKQVDLAHKLYFHRSSVIQRDPQGGQRILISGELVDRVSNMGDLALALMDNLNMEGVWEIYADRLGVMTGLGWGSAIWSGVLKLGTVVVFSHQRNWGTSLGRAHVDLGLSENLDLKLKAGEIVRIPLEADTQGTVEFDVPQDVTVEGYHEENRLKGGELGLIIDLRGRPLPSLEDVQLYREFYPHWREALS